MLQRAPQDPAPFHLSYLWQQVKLMDISEMFLRAWSKTRRNTRETSSEGQGSLMCCGPWGRRVGHDWGTGNNTREAHLCLSLWALERGPPNLISRLVPPKNCFSELLLLIPTYCCEIAFQKWNCWGVCQNLGSLCTSVKQKYGDRVTKKRVASLLC